MVSLATAARLQIEDDGQAMIYFIMGLVFQTFFFGELCLKSVFAEISRGADTPPRTVHHFNMAIDPHALASFSVRLDGWGPDCLIENEG